MDCTSCQSKGCRNWIPCSDNKAQYADQYGLINNQMRAKSAAKLVDNGRAGTLNRLNEIIEYCHLQGHLKIGVAYCYGLEKEALLFKQYFKKEGFKMTMVSCTVDGLSETDIDPNKTKKVVSCNPLGQAYALNQQRVDFVILVGLCLGHDVILQKALQADFTTFIVKDRVLKHNTVLTLNNGKSPEDDFMEEIPGSFHILKMDDFIQMLREPDCLEKNYFLDLRDAPKHAENGIRGSLQCLVRQLPEKYRELLPEKTKKIIVYCNGGQMSLYAVMYLKLKGYTDVLSLAGGYNKYLDIKSKE